MSAGLNTRRSPVVIALSALAFLALAAFPASASVYDPPDVARLSGIVGEAYVLGDGDTEWSYAEPNLIVEEGDLLQTNESGMAEVQFQRGLTLRIGESSRVAVVEMDDEKVVGIDSGRAYLRVTRDLSAYGEFIITFPSGQLTAIEKTLARIDVFPDGGVELKVFRGEIELETESEGLRTIRSGERVIINPQGETEVTRRGFARMDDFDAWNEERDIALSTYRRSDYIEQDIVGAEELDGYGEWVYSRRVSSHVWRPYVVDVWKPYYHGRWYYSSLSGWTWIPEEPWGYVTHHYGVWEYDPHYGWIWVPGYKWRPAHVSWVVYDDYVGWTPLGYYGYPVTTRYPYYVTDIYVDVAHVVSITFVHIHHFHHRHGHRRHHDHHGDRDDKFHNGRHDDDRHGGGHGDHDGGNTNNYPPKREWNKLDYDGRLHAEGASGETDRNRMPSGSRGGRIDIKNRLAAEGGTLDLAKIKNGKVRFANNPENLNLQKVSHKGGSAFRKIDHEKILDVKGHPELRSKVRKFDGSARGTGKVRAASSSAGLPKKVGRDNVRNLDFRGRVEERKSVNGRVARAEIRSADGKDSKFVEARSKVAKKSVSRVGEGKTVAKTDNARASQRLSTKKVSTGKDPISLHRKRWEEFKSVRDRERVERTRKVASTGKTSVRRIEINADDIKRAEAGKRRDKTRASVPSIPRERQKISETPRRQAPTVRSPARSERNGTAKREMPSRMRQGRSTYDSAAAMPARSAPARVSRPSSSRESQRRITRPTTSPMVAEQPSVASKRASGQARSVGAQRTHGATSERAFSGRSSTRSGMQTYSGSRASSAFARSRGHRR